MKITLSIKHNDKVYHQPYCRLKVSGDGGVSYLIKENDKWHPISSKEVQVLKIEISTMKKITYKGIKIKIYTNAMEFATMPEKPFGEIPEGATFSRISNNCKSTGFTTLQDKTIRIFVDEGCKFEDLLSTVSHELGHLVEGGFKKNPPDKARYAKRHEQKAEHYEIFALDALNVTGFIFEAIGVK